MYRSRWRRNVRDTHERGPSLSTALTAIAPIAALVSLVAAACSGEHALNARDASGLAGAGGKGGAGTGGNAGTLGDAGTGGGLGATAGTAGTGGDGTGGGGGGGTGGMRAMGTGVDGSNCSSGGDCMSSWCVDTVCCATECAGACMTCKGATPGVCVPAADGTNPRNACAVQSPASCGTTGLCNATGACRYHPSGQVCDATPSCDATNSSVVTMRACNGSGGCVPTTSQSCNGYRCAAAPPAAPACGTTCSADSDCAPNAFCSASACYPSGSVNIAGNGDLETGTTYGWVAANGGGAISLSAVASSGVAHGGGYSIVGTNRTFAYHGPGYNLPTGPGKYVISAWGLQRDLTEILGSLQVRLACLTNVNPGYYVAVRYDHPMPQNVWTLFSATIDTTMGVGTDCLPTGATPGLVRSAMLYLNHNETVPSPFPNLYLDDVIVQVTDGHNLVGNPNFEAGLPDTWSLSAGSSTLAVTNTVAHGGTQSLHQSGRSIPAAGPRYNLPTGTARYVISFWVRHSGTEPHDLMLQPTYNCITPSGAMTPPPIATAMAVAGDTWTRLQGTATFPPADAAPGCKLLVAAVYVRNEGTACSGACPDLFIDDVSITLAP